MSRVEKSGRGYPDVGNQKQGTDELVQRRMSVRERRRLRSIEAATRFMDPLLETVETQVKTLETSPGGSLPHPIAGLASWGVFNGITISTARGIDSLYSYFPHIPRMERGREMSRYTNGEVTYGGLLADRIQHLLTDDLQEEGRPPSKEAVWRRTKSIVTTLRSWSRIPLLPGFLVKQFLWYVPDPDKSIMDNLPIVCQETQASLELLSQGASDSLGPALIQIVKELDKASRLVASLKSGRHGITSFAIPRPYEPLLLPFRVTAEEYLEENGVSPASRRFVATEIAEAYLLGRHGFNPESVKSILGYFAGKPPARGVPLELNGFKFESAVCSPIVPWLVLEFQRLGICGLTKADYEALGLPPNVWRDHLFELKEQQILDPEVFSSRSPDILAEVYKQHHLMINSPPQPPRVNEKTLVLAVPGKYYPWPHLRHRAIIRTGLEVARSGVYGDAVVMTVPNRRDPNYPEMEIVCPAKARARRLKETLTGLLGQNLFVTPQGQEDDIGGNEDKFNFGFPRYLKRRFGISPELGFVGGLEKAPLYRGRRVVLAPRLSDLVNLPRALGEMKEEIENYGEGKLVIALLSCMDYSGQRIRDLIERGDEESLIQLSTMLHRSLLLELEKNFRSAGKTAAAKTLHQLLT